MKLTIDNLDGRGPWDYTAYLDGAGVRVARRLNKPTEVRFSLVASGPDFVVPVSGARVMVGQLNGQDVFTGYLTGAPKYEYLGWGGQGPVNTSCPFNCPTITRAPLTGTTKSGPLATRLKRTSVGLFSRRATRTPAPSR